MVPVFTVPVFYVVAYTCLLHVPVFVYVYRLTCSRADMGVEIAYAQLKYFLLHP